MPSDPYQSQFLPKILRQTRHWLDRGQESVRQMQVAANWGAQILLYPVYALFQSARSLGKTLGNVIQPEDSSLPGNENLDEIKISQQSTSLEVTADTPLQQVLEAIEDFSLLERLPIGSKPQVIRVRAIACLIETRSLVLVTQFNQVWDVLTPYQQDELAQQIIYEVAAYARSRRPKSFRERVVGALQGARSRLSSLLRPASSAFTALPAAVHPATSTALSVDTSVQQSMLAVRGWLSEIDTSSLQPSLTMAATVPASSNPSAPSPIYIRGVAIELETRSLVLVNNRNEILDILSTEQQAIVQQRIAWEVAHYYRYLRLRYAAEQIEPVRSPSPNSPVFPGVRPFYQLMAWMQRGSVASATNLFKEADLANSLPTLMGSPVPSIHFSHLRDRLNQTLNQALNAIHRSNSLVPSAQPESSESKPTALTGIDSAQMVDNQASQPIDKIQRSSDIADSLEIPNLLENPEIIDTEATLMGYELSLLEQIMRLLDFCFFWIEEFIQLIWNGWLKLRSPK
jgi:hypothetical protein